jgi:hypothetical protein
MMHREMKRRNVLLTATLVMAGCHVHHPAATPLSPANPTTLPATAPTGLAAAPTAPAVQPSAPSAVKPVPGVVAPRKPFIALPPNPLHASARPSVLLLAHARADSPVPLSEYAKQPVYALSDFDLWRGLSATHVQRLLGPPAQLADYADPWFVYRLDGGQELWLHFSQPGDTHLLAADVIGAAEDGYTRQRVFSANDSR